MNDILHNLVHEIYLPAVEIVTLKVLRKCSLSRIHIQTDNLADELTQRLRAVLLLIFFPGSQFGPKDLFQCLYIIMGQRNIGF